MDITAGHGWNCKACACAEQTVTLQPTRLFSGEGRKTAVADKDLAEFIKVEKMPPTLEFNDDNSYKIFNSGIEKQVGACFGAERAMHCGAE